MQKEFKNKDGSIDIIDISSNDNYDINLDRSYKLVHPSNVNSKFKNSILGSDIGIKSRGFSTIVLLSTLLSIGALLIMYFNFKI